MADGFEQLLTERAADLPHTLLLRMIRECEARLDQDGLAPREETMRAARSLRLWEDSAGRLRLAGVFDPETGAPIKGAVEALVTEMIRASGKGGGEETQTVIPDERTIVQMQADAMSMIARHVAGQALRGGSETTDQPTRTTGYYRARHATADRARLTPPRQRRSGELRRR